MEPKKKQARLKILPTGDRRSQFYYHRTAKEVLESLGPPRRLLSTSTKTKKSAGVAVMQRVLYFSPGVFCPASSRGCLAACLGHSSGRMSLHAEARDRRSALFVEDRDYFMQILRADLDQLRIDARHAGMIPAVRLNGTSDLSWERYAPELFREYADLQFLDYTKIANRMRDFLFGKTGVVSWPENYHLTFSLSEETKNRRMAEKILALGGNVAVVFDKLPEKYLGVDVIDGDLHDARFLDPKGVIIGLRAKGNANQDQSGFVVRPKSESTLRSGYEQQLAS